jgi:predicted phosphodiesterase
MRTLLISDLHLGSLSGGDLLRDAELRAPLLELAADADRVVLLGDVLELRQGPAREALAAAREFFEELGRVLAGAELIVVAGNHDHALLEPWLSRRGEQDAPEPLAIEQLIAPHDGSPMLARLSEWAAPASVLAAYPGLWVRDDVYATHGHYLDCHISVPTLERLSVGAMSRLLGRPASEFSCVEDYEAVTAPVYVWHEAVARSVRTGDALNDIASVRAWRALGGGSDGSAAASAPRRARLARDGLARKLSTRALVAAFPLAVAALNRAGLGPLRAEISGTELRRAGLRAMGEVVARLGVEASYVVFGHTHRSGPLARDDEREWRVGYDSEDGVSATAAGAASAGDGLGAGLINAGSWTYSSVFLTSTPGESPYWPGTCVVVEDSGAPTVERLLADRSHEELRLARRRARTRG